MVKPYTHATQAMLAEARKRGKRKGAGAADVQYLPGGGRDTARDAAGRARAMLKEYDEGYPEWAHPPDWLSGEWADEPTHADIAKYCGVDPDRDPDGNIAMEVCNTYVDEADYSYINYIVQHLRDVAGG